MQTMIVMTGHSKRSQHLVQLEGILADALFSFSNTVSISFSFINLGIIKLACVDHIRFRDLR
jgi:hypothetical protein